MGFRAEPSVVVQILRFPRQYKNADAHKLTSSRSSQMQGLAMESKQLPRSPFTVSILYVPFACNLSDVNHRVN